MSKNESPSARSFETYREDFQSMEDRYLELWRYL